MSTTPNEPAPTPTPPASQPPAPTPPATPATKDDPIQLPEDHPLVKAYNAQKEQIKSLKSDLVDPDELKRLRELDEASKTDAQKRDEEIERLRKENESYKTREQIAAWAEEVSKETEVPAALLRGSTKEELEAHAVQLKPLIGQQQTTEETRPGIVPTVGKAPTAPPNIPIGQQIAAAEQARDQHEVGSPEWKAASAQVMALKGMQLSAAAKTV